MLRVSQWVQQSAGQTITEVTDEGLSACSTSTPPFTAPVQVVTESKAL